MNEVERSALSASPDPRRGKSYFIGLDAVRIITALIVAIFHFTWQNPEASHVAIFGWVGVQIFFVISGLVIANSANNVSAIHFVKHRILRLYPAAFACAVLGVMPLILNHASLNHTVNAFLRSFFLFFHSPWLGTAYWTLPIEMSFYALLFFALLSGSFRYLEWLAALLAVVSCGYLILLTAYWMGFTPFSWLEFGYGIKNMLLLRHGVFFSLGILLWLRQMRCLTSSGGIIFLPALAGAGMEIFCRAAEVAPKFVVPGNVLSIFVISACVWLCGCGLILLSLRVSIPAAWVDSLPYRCVRGLGRASYPLYLLHEAIGLPTIDALQFIGGSWFPVKLVCAIVVVLTASLVVSEYVEPWLRSLMRPMLDGLDQRYMQRSPLTRRLYIVEQPIQTSVRSSATRLSP